MKKKQTKESARVTKQMKQMYDRQMVMIDIERIAREAGLHVHLVCSADITDGFVITTDEEQCESALCGLALETITKKL